MRAWRCPTCEQVVFLSSSQCLRCGTFLGFRPSTRGVEALGDGTVVCATSSTSGCTWIVEDAWAGADQCVACRQVTLVPPLDDPTTARLYRSAADDHRHLVVQLLELELPVDAVELRLPSGRYDDSVVIGHVDGVVTLDVDEADDARREAQRHSLGERYRTVLGHLRHEFGHALRPHLVGPADVERVRSLFGDERLDYQAALDQHYAEGPPAGWQRSHVSAYATTHPHEDWAETFAHLLHITDVLTTADSYGLSIDPVGAAATALPPPDGLDVADRATGGVDTPGSSGSMRGRLARFVPLVFALNEVTRSLGEGELYPFVISERAAEKLDLVADLVGLGDQPVTPVPPGVA